MGSVPGAGRRCSHDPAVPSAPSAPPLPAGLTVCPFQAAGGFAGSGAAHPLAGDPAPLCRRRTEPCLCPGTLCHLCPVPAAAPEHRSRSGPGSGTSGIAPSPADSGFSPVRREPDCPVAGDAPGQALLLSPGPYASQEACRKFPEGTPCGRTPGLFLPFAGRAGRGPAIGQGEFL